MPWAITPVVLMLVALGAYSFGAHQEAVAAGTSAGGAWRFSPFPGIWMLFILFWFLGGLRRMFWGGCYRPWRYRRHYYSAWRDDDRDDWEEWHRREHDKMHGSRSPGTSSRPEPSQGPV
jgi:hypothetical protein